MSEKSIIEAAEREWDRFIEHLKFHHGRHHPMRLVLTKSINNSIFQLMNAALAANQQQVFQFGLTDIVNPATVVTGTYTNGAVVSDTPGVCTGSVDSSGNVNFVAVAPGTANLVASALASYTDSTGAPQSQQLSTDPIPVTVTAVVTADGVKLVLVPGAITQQAAPAAAATT